MSDPAQDTPGITPVTVSPNKQLFNVLRHSMAGDQSPIAVEPELPEITSIAASLPTAVQSMTDTAPISYSGSRSGSPKEVSQLNFSVEKSQIDNVPGVQYVE